jgi:hypothetical protein
MNNHPCNQVLPVSDQYIKYLTGRFLIQKEQWMAFWLTGVLFVFLSLYYIFLVQPQYAYMGYCFEPSLVRTILSWCLFILLFLLAFRFFYSQPFLFSIFILLMLFYYIPNAILFSFSHSMAGIVVAHAILLTVFFSSAFYRFDIPRFNLPFGQYLPGLLLTGCLVLFFILAFKTRSTLNLNTLLLRDVYETRAEFSKHLTGMLNYFFHILTKCLLPLLIIYLYITRQYLLMGIALMMLLWTYVLSGHKIIYLTAFLVLFFLYVGKNHVNKVNSLLTCMIGLLLLFILVDSWLLDEPLLMGTFVNRMLFIPALLNQFYFTYFDGQPLFFAESNLFSWFVSSPYEKPVGYLIIEHFWNEEGVYGNNGIITDGFINAGWVGVLILSILFSALIAFLNALNLHPSYFGLFAEYIYLFLSAPFFMIFLSGGMFIFIVLALALPRSPTDVST